VFSSYLGYVYSPYSYTAATYWPTHGQGADEAVALQNRENGTPEVWMWRDTECGTPPDFGMRGGPEKTVGRDLGRQGILRESNAIFEESGEKGGGGKPPLGERRQCGEMEVRGGGDICT